MSADTDYAVLRHVLKEYEPKGWAAEFGVYSGLSLGIIAARMPVVGFDSFEGLPEDWREGFPKGAFSDEWNGGWSVIPTETPWNAMMVQGWFKDTVPDFPFPTLGLVHVDCDLYSSTKTVLSAIRPHIQDGTIVVFDEYRGYPGHEDHEMKAWTEFLAGYGNAITATEIASGEQEAAFRIEEIRSGF